MGDLHDNGPIYGMSGANHFFQPIQHGIVMRAGLGWSGFPDFTGVSVSGYDQSHFAFGKISG